MKILLVYPNVSHNMTPQMGLLSLGSYLVNKGVDVQICDLSFFSSKNYENILERNIETWEPDIIGVSCRTMEFPVAQKICQMVKQKHPNKLLIAGGPHMTFCPEALISSIDFGIIGEGEEALLEVVNAIDQNHAEDIFDLQNICYIKNNKMTVNNVRPLLDIGSLPMPKWELFDERHYFKHYCLQIKKGTHVCGSFEGSRGCLFKCTYCSNEKLMSIYKGFGQWRREKPVDKIRAEILDFKSKYGLDLIYFIDEVIMTSDKRTEEIRNGLIDLRIPFIFMERPELINETRIRNLKEAGAYSCSIGVETANEEFRKNILQRHMKDETILNAFSMMRKHGIKTHSFFMLGMPGQTEQIIKETYQLIKTLQPDSAQATTFFPLPGTILELRCKEQHLLPKEIPTSYYGTSYLTYEKRYKRQIEIYANLINIGAWKNRKLRGIVEFIGIYFPFIIFTIQRMQSFSGFLSQQGIRATLQKIINKA
jgi:radical SAM superfamily enzyme YgiQ (UPF0313 family)